MMRALTKICPLPLPHVIITHAQQLNGVIGVKYVRQYNLKILINTQDIIYNKFDPLLQIKTIVFCYTGKNI